MTRITVAEACEITGRSETWLRSHECGWCSQTALEAVRGNCASFDGQHRCTTQEAVERCRKPTWRAADLIEGKLP